MRMPITKINTERLFTPHTSQRHPNHDHVMARYWRGGVAIDLRAGLKSTTGELDTRCGAQHSGGHFSGCELPRDAAASRSPIEAAHPRIWSQSR